MQELIMKSKYHKQERQKAADEVSKLVEQVDADLDEIRSLLIPNLPKPNSVPRPPGGETEAVAAEKESRERPRRAMLPSQQDDYDRFVRELRHESRSAPSNRLKTEEELALEAKEKLEELEVRSFFFYRVYT
jgi:nucleolar protein 14